MRAHKGDNSVRLKTDEQRVLSGDIDGLSESRLNSILSRFRVHGILDESGKLTVKGTHVATKYGAKHAEVYGQIGSGVASQSGPGNRRRNSAGSRNSDRKSGAGSDAKTTDVTSGIVLSDAGNLSRADAGVEFDPGTVSETTAVSPGRSAFSD